VSVEARDAGDYVEIKERDSGDGVPAELLPRLFGKFARGAVSREKGGTGLGLSIVQGLAQANGGDAWYEPNTPHGSCFGVRLRKIAA
jgi:signal transduction histidine kinase